MEPRAVPEGFLSHFKRSPFRDPWEPLFSRRGEKSVQLGVWLREAHCNSRDLLHGGVIVALADNAMGLAFIASQQAARSALTVSFNVDYLATAKIGQWLLIEPRVVKTGTTLGFVDGLIAADGETIARATVMFRFET